MPDAVQCGSYPAARAGRAGRPQWLMSNAISNPHHRADAGIDFASGSNAILGLWLIGSPWVVGYSSASLWNSLVVGVLVFVLAVVRIGSQSRASVPSWVNTLLGLWLVVSAFVLPGLTPGRQWNFLGLGIVVVLLALTSMASGVTRTR